MANEATVQNSLTIRKVDDVSGRTLLEYASRPQAFQADVTGTKGPTPGAITATTDGTDVSFSQLERPGLCRIMNLDGDNFVTVGIWDPDVSLFFPLIELLPGEHYTVRLSRYLSEEFVGVTTGTGVANNTLRIKADTADCFVSVEAFEA